jgi:glycosyltransferase involved in cell wall biosynthesis
MGRLFTSGSVKQGDHFLFTDAWHPGIINLKYMSELLGIKVTIHALWHAGSYDPQDFLGRLIGDAAWVRHSEKAFFAAIDHNYFATDFHIRMFEENLFAGEVDKNKIVRSGWPMEYMPAALAVFKELPKRDLILFPHRLAPEKQVEIFRDLKAVLPQYEFIICQDTPLTKVQYHALLATAKIVFSANLQETLGISMYEGALVDAVPLVPDRLSYSEMFSKIWKYPSAWTESWDNYQQHKQELVAKIVDLMDNYDDYAEYVPQQAASLTNNFFSATKLLENIQ